MKTDKVNILLVDDQPGKLLTYETILDGLNENLVKAESADEALQHLLRTEFAVVLLDVCMPNIDGFELASLIRQHPRCQRTAIIFISAIQFTHVDQLKGYESGAVDYISVPVVPELLRARVMVFADLYRKNAELEQMNRLLEQRVAERTAELERDLGKRKLLEAALLDAARRKDEFLAMLAHELRNPLAPICSAAEILQSTQANPETVQSLSAMIERQVNQMVRLVDDLLDVSRVSRGRIELRRERIELAAAVNQAVETAGPMCKSKNHELSVKLSPQPIWLNADPVRLTQIVGNLLNNACKFTEQGGRISLTVEQSGTQVLIRVRDSGVGIAAEQLPRIFEMFTQLDISLERQQSGLGIGLTLVKNLVEMHDGTIEASSAGLGQGSEFVVRLPTLIGKSESLSRAPTVSEPALLSGRRILVVDDNRGSANAMAMLLKMSGNETHTAFDGLEGVEAAEKLRPDLVLLDIGMPKLNGYAAARHIREQPWGKSMVLVALSGWGQDEDRRKTAEAGFNGHLVKPVRHTEMIKLLTSLLA